MEERIRMGSYFSKEEAKDIRVAAASCELSIQEFIRDACCVKVREHLEVLEAVNENR